MSKSVLDVFSAPPKGGGNTGAVQSVFSAPPRIIAAPKPAPIRNPLQASIGQNNNASLKGQLSPVWKKTPKPEDYANQTFTPLTLPIQDNKIVQAGEAVNRFIAPFLGSPTVQKPVGKAVEVVHASVKDAADRVNIYLDSVQSSLGPNGKPINPSDKAAKLLEAATGVVNAIFSPISGTIAALGETGVGKYPVAGLNAIGGKIDEVARVITNHIIDATPFSKNTKNNLKPAIGEIASLAANLFLLEKAGKLPGKTENLINGPTKALNEMNLRAAVAEQNTKIRVKNETPGATNVPVKDTTVRFIPDEPVVAPSTVREVFAQPPKTEAIGTGKIKERGMITTAKENPGIAPQVKDNLSGDYNQVVLRHLKDASDSVVAKNPEAAIRQVREASVNTAEGNALAVSVIEHLQKRGTPEAYSNVVDIIHKYAERATKQGQANATLALLERLTPSGAIKYADSVYRRIRAEFPDAKRIDISEALAKQLATQAEKIQKIPNTPENARLRTIETAKLYKVIYEQVPSSVSRRVGMIQTMAQLLNPKTIVRNLIGNTGFTLGANLANVVGTGIDAVIGKVTGQRTQTLPSIRTQVKGFVQGAKEGVQDARLGINTSPANTQFELQQQVFTNRLGKAAEAALNYSLRVPDRAAWQSAYSEAMRNELAVAKMNGTKMNAREVGLMDERAKVIASERTFQDTNRITQIFTGIKTALNRIGNQEFGLGDFILKYPKTPANIFARGIEYSPAGFVRAAIELVKPLAGKEFNQRQFVKSTSEAIVGTGTGVVLGAVLHRLGIITGKKEDNQSVVAFQRSVGLGQYRMNVSALKRFVFSGFNTDQAKLRRTDVLVSYDWFQPAAIALSMGANIDDNKGAGVGVLTTALDSIAEGSNTLSEQPLVKNFQQLFKGKTIGDGLISSLTGAPASFVPTFLAQLRQLEDNTSRNTYSPSKLQTAWNLVVNKLPFLSKTLPASVSPAGETGEIYPGGSNSIVNVFLNPAFVSTYQGDKSADLLLEQYQKSGDVQIFPHVVQKTITYQGQKYQLTGDQMEEYQRFIGAFAKKSLERVASGTIDQYNEAAQRELLTKAFDSIAESGKMYILRKLYQSGQLKQEP